MSTVIVSGIPSDLTQDALQDYFSRVGPVSALELQGDGTARVTLESADDLSAALDLNGNEYREGVVLKVAAAPAPGEAAPAAAPAEGQKEETAAVERSTRRPRFEEGKAIVIRNVPAGLRNAAKIRELFGPLGEITELHLDPRGCRFVFITYATKEAAEAAAAKNGETVEDGVLVVELRSVEGAKRLDARLVVKNLPLGVTESQIREVFATAGTLTDFFLKDDKQFCFVSYATAEEAERAMALNGHDIGGNAIIVEHRETPKCFRCGKEGHIGAQCRSPSSNLACHNCGRVGHKARDCRQPPSRGGRRDDYRGGGRRDRDDDRDRRRRRSDSYDRPARRRSRSPPRRRRSPPSRSRSPPRQRQRHHSRSRSPPRRRY